MAIQKTTSTTIKKNISDLLAAHSKNIWVTLSCVVALIGIFFVHKLWVIKREQSAQYALSALMTEYDTMLREKDPQWSALLEKFEAAYVQHARSSLLPYYRGYKVNILLQQNKKDEALATLDTMIADMPQLPLAALYEMERALIQLDDADATRNEVGLETLKTLAADTTNMYRDSAQFYLGRYYWAMNQIDDARAAWQQLVDEQRDEKMAPSPWVNEVQEKLALTIV